MVQNPKIKRTIKKMTKKARVMRAPVKRRYNQISNSPSGRPEYRLVWPMPENTMCKLRYNDIKSLTCTSGAYNFHQFNISSLYDPDYTAIGHQPYGYDQISGLFSAYCVRYVEITLKVQAPTSPMRVWLEPKFNNASTTSNMSLVSERTRTISFGVSDSPVIKRFRVYLPSLAGVSWEWWKRECSAVPSASPTTSTYFNIYTQPVDLINTCSLCYEIEIKFDALFTQPTNQAQS